jgi:hypothetical protein
MVAARLHQARAKTRQHQRKLEQRWLRVALQIWSIGSHPLNTSTLGGDFEASVFLGFVSEL